MKKRQRVDKWRVRLPRRKNMLVDGTVYASTTITVDDKALDQLCDAAALPSVRHALATPDIHVGYGVPIGAVVATKDIVVPAAVGYDINCGMRLLATPFSEDELDFRELNKRIAATVPLGEGRQNLRLRHKDFRRLVEGGMAAYLETDLGDRRLERYRDATEEDRDRCHMEDLGSLPASTKGVSKRAIERGACQLGTLGGGNHFIEFQVVDEVYRPDIATSFGLHLGMVTVMIHSGSRGFGHEIGGTYMQLAAKLNRQRSPSAELCFLDSNSSEGQQFVLAMGAAANFAFLNRQLMTAAVRGVLRSCKGDVPLPLVYDISHNMVKAERHGDERLWVHRKGATRALPPSRMQSTIFAETGQPVLIPGSMGTASYVLVGTEASRESLHSVNHGAGRVLSRSAARGRHGKGRRPSRPAAISDRDFARSMAGIELLCANRRTIKEEAPAAYKDIDEVIRVVRGAGLALPVVRLTPLSVLKG